MTKKPKPEQKLFAFWSVKYDLFPFVLGAEITKWRENGTICAKGYDGMHFTPLKVLPLEAGLKLKQKLEELQNERQIALGQFNKQWRAKLNGLASFIMESK